jgi:hypothetical protein
MERTRAIIDQAYRERLAVYEQEGRAAIYLNVLQKAATYHRKGYRANLIKSDLWQVYSLSDLQARAKAPVEDHQYMQVKAYDVTVTKCSCSEARGFRPGATCVHREIVKLEIDIEKLCRAKEPDPVPS